MYVNIRMLNILPYQYGQGTKKSENAIVIFTLKSIY